MSNPSFLRFWAVLTALVAALSLGPSFAHVLESVPRMTVWSPELWRETTVFNGQFQLFATVGAPLDISAITLPAVLAFLLRGQRRAMWLAIATAVLFALSLALWATIVAPANAVLATWTPGPVPDDFEAIRDRWEYGHMCVAAAKAVGVAMLAAALVNIDACGPDRLR